MECIRRTDSRRANPTQSACVLPTLGFGAIKPGCALPASRPRLARKPYFSSRYTKIAYWFSAAQCSSFVLPRPTRFRCFEACRNGGLSTKQDLLSIKHYERAGTDHRRGFGGIGSGMAMCAPRGECRFVRNAPGEIDARSPDRRLCRTGLLELSEIRL